MHSHVCETHRSVLPVKMITDMLQPHLSPVATALRIRSDDILAEGTPEPASRVVTEVHVLAKFGRDIHRRPSVVDDEVALQLLLRSEVLEASSAIRQSRSTFP
jgi:hypothetical protein